MSGIIHNKNSIYTKIDNYFDVIPENFPAFCKTLGNLKKLKNHTIYLNKKYFLKNKISLNWFLNEFHHAKVIFDEAQLAKLCNCEESSKAPIQYCLSHVESMIDFENNF